MRTSRSAIRKSTSRKLPPPNSVSISRKGLRSSKSPIAGRMAVQRRSYCRSMCLDTSSNRSSSRAISSFWAIAASVRVLMQSGLLFRQGRGVAIAGEQESNLSSKRTVSPLAHPVNPPNSTRIGRFNHCQRCDRIVHLI